MTTILWTKSTLQKEVNNAFDAQFHHEFLEVIAIRHLHVVPFDLRNHSLIFTSVNGVRAFFENGFLPKEKLTDLAHFNKIYAVGIRTKKELRKYGFGTFKVKKHAADLADFILQNSSNESFLHFCGNLALDILDKKLPLQNIDYKKIEVYETHLLYPRNDCDFDAIAFFSPSGVRSFVKYNSLEGKTVFSIGQTTEKELKKHTQQPIITSTESTSEDLIQRIKNYYSKK